MLTPKKTVAKDLPTRAKNPRKPSDPTNQTPLCLWEQHSKRGIHHYLRNCRECPKDVKDRLFDEHRGKRKEHTKRTSENSSTDSRSVVLTATFGEHYKTTVCADTCSDDNIIDERMLNNLRNAGVDHIVEDLPRTRTFHMAANLPDGTPASLTCSQVVTVDAELHIRHGSALALLGVRWLVTKQAVGEPLLGRPFLESLVLNTRDIPPAGSMSRVFSPSSALPLKSMLEWSTYPNYSTNTPNAYKRQNR